MKNQNLKFKNKLQERVYIYTLKLINFLDTLPKDTSCEIISRQLLRSGTSIGANMFGAQASSSKRDFTNFFHYSLKSANETKYWLFLLQDAKNIESPDLEYLISETMELSNILASSILTLKGKN